MRFLSTRVHGMMDYLTGGLLIIAPWLFGFADGSAAQWVPVVLGIGIMGISLLSHRGLRGQRLASTSGKDMT